MQKRMVDDKLTISELYGGPTVLDSLSHVVSFEELRRAIYRELGQFAVKAENDRMRVYATDPSGAFKTSLLGFNFTPDLDSGYIVTFVKDTVYFEKVGEYCPVSGGTLDELLNELTSFINKIKGKVAVAFSGGIDSSLTSWLLRGNDPLLITLGEASSHDVVKAKRSAKLMGLRLEIVMPENISEAVKTVSPFSRTAMDYSLAAGFYMVSKKAKDFGAKWLITGQMADELFGGYARYRNIENQTINEVLLKDFLNSNLQRDALAIMSGGTLPVFPYASRPFADIALGLPEWYKVNKLGLRVMASMAKLPEEIVKSEKKAFQYGSGMQKIVNKILFN